MAGGTTKARGRWQATALVVLWLALTATSSFAQNNTQNFSAFYARFRTAVAHKDEAALKAMMDPHFAFLRAENVPPVVFQAPPGRRALAGFSLARSAVLRAHPVGVLAVGLLTAGCRRESGSKKAVVGPSRRF